MSKVIRIDRNKTAKTLIKVRNGLYMKKFSKKYLDNQFKHVKFFGKSKEELEQRAKELCKDAELWEDGTLGQSEEHAVVVGEG